MFSSSIFCFSSFLLLFVVEPMHFFFCVSSLDYFLFVSSIFGWFAIIYRVIIYMHSTFFIRLVKYGLYKNKIDTIRDECNRVVRVRVNVFSLVCVFLCDLLKYFLFFMFTWCIRVLLAFYEIMRIRKRAFSSSSVSFQYCIGFSSFFDFLDYHN